MKKLFKHSLTLAVLVVFGFLLAVSRGYLAEHQVELKGERDLYLPEADYLKFIAMGHDGLVSDLLLAKALTYYGSHYKERDGFGFKHLKKLFVTAVKMDPMNKDAFLMAGNILSDIDVHDAIDVLKLGMKYHPRYWKFPEMIGFHYFYRLNDSYNAGKYYEMAAAMPGHPPYVPSLSGKLYQESGRYEEAIRVLYNFYSTTSDKRLKKSFKESIEQLQERIKNRDFLLKARVLKVRGPAELEFEPDRLNPQFRALRPRETIVIETGQTGVDGVEEKHRRLFRIFQTEYALAVLEDREIRVRLKRLPDGRFDRDDQKRLTGEVILSNNRPYKLFEIEQFPPPVMEFEPENIHNFLGKVISLRFRVHRVEVTEAAVYLHTGSQYRNRFSVGVGKSHVGRFLEPGITVRDFFKTLQGRTVTVAGFLKLRSRQDRRMEIGLYDPIQLKY